MFAASVWWDNAANRGIDPPPATPIPFTADLPRGGVNTYNLHAEVVFRPGGTVDPQNNVRRTFELIAAAGIHWVRVQFPWEDIEVGGKGNFVDTRPSSTGSNTWAKYDYIVGEARRNGLALLVRLDTPPDWARTQALASPELAAARAAGRYPLTGPPDNYADFGDFVAAVAERYRDDLRFFQIWNEPNLPGEWNFRKQDPAELVELLRIARQRIKAVNPQAVIVFPALAPTDGRSDGVNDLDYLQGVYDAGGRELFDIMSAQLYGLGQPPTEHRYIKPGASLLQPIDTKADVGRVVLLREIMMRNGDANKAVWISELGWNSAPKTLGDAALRWGEPVSEARKGEYLVQAMQRAEQEWPWAGPMYVWMLRFGGPPPDPRDPTPFFQLVDADFNPLPAYTIVQEYLTRGSADQLPPARRNPLAAATTVGAAGLVLATSVWASGAFGGLISGVAKRWPRRWRSWQRPAWASHNGLMLTLLGLALAFFYWGSTFQERAQLPISAAGAALFGGLAVLRPDLALLFVPATVPLYLAPKGIWDQEWGVRPAGILFPLHEFVLWSTVVGTALHFLGRTSWRPRLAGIGRRQEGVVARLRPVGVLWPVLLFLLAGTVGVGVAVARGPALREWRWLIVEPTIFYALVRYWAHDERHRWRLITAWLVSGVVVALIGLGQLTGVDLTALLPRSSCFSDRVVLAEGGLRRISSVYCHPNNLGLAIGRVWPVLAALGLLGVGRGQGSTSAAPTLLRSQTLPLLGAGLCLAALAASFSKGALIGAFVALLVLGVLLRGHNRPVALVLLGGAVAGALAVLALSLVFGVERLNPLGGSSGARIELWTAALRMVRDHPWTGVGLDQFYHYRNAPDFGDRYIAVAARATTEQFAAHPHNFVLDFLVRLGPLGLVALGWLMVHFFRQARRRQASGALPQALVFGMVASVAAALTHGLVDNLYFVPDLAFAFWLMLGIFDSAEPHSRPTSSPMQIEQQPSLSSTKQPALPRAMAKLTSVGAGKQHHPTTGEQDL